MSEPEAAAPALLWVRDGGTFRGGVSLNRSAPKPYGILELSSFHTWAEALSIAANRNSKVGIQNNGG